MFEIKLRPPEDRDYDVLQGIRNDFGTQAMLLGHPEARPGSDDVRTWINRRSNDPDGSFLVIDHAGSCAGFAQLTSTHRIDRHAYFGIALSADARGIGVGRQAMTALVRHARQIGLRKLLCEVRYDNEPAITLYRKLGFRDVGVLRLHYDDGVQQWDVVVMELLLDESS